MLDEADNLSVSAAIIESDLQARGRLRAAFWRALVALNATHVVTSDVRRKLSDMVTAAFVDRFLATTSMTDDDIDAIAATGLRHLLAVSGVAEMKH